MNVIPRLPKDHIYFSAISLEHVIYFYMLSQVVTIKGTMWCENTTTEIYDLFSRFYSEKDIEYALKSLADKKVIFVTDDDIDLGTASATIKQLHTGNTDTWDVELETLKQLINSYISASKGARVSIPNKLFSDVNKLFDMEISKWRTHEFMLLFRYTHEATFQEIKPDFDKAEIGIMANLVRKYSLVILVKMVINYITRADLYSKSMPTLRSLSFFKEQVYANVTGLKTVKRESLRTERIDDEF